MVERRLQDELSLLGREGADLERLAPRVVNEVPAVAMLVSMLPRSVEQNLDVLRTHRVVVAESSDPTPPGQGYAVVEGGRADHVPAHCLVAGIRPPHRAIVEADPGIADLGDDLLGLRRRAVPGDDHLDVGVGLSEDRGQRPVAQALEAVIGGDHERDERLGFGEGQLVLLAGPERVQPPALRAVFLVDVLQHRARLPELIQGRLETSGQPLQTLPGATQLPPQPLDRVGQLHHAPILVGEVVRKAGEIGIGNPIGLVPQQPPDRPRHRGRDVTSSRRAQGRARREAGTLPPRAVSAAGRAAPRSARRDPRGPAWPPRPMGRRRATYPRGDR